MKWKTTFAVKVLKSFDNEILVNSKYSTVMHEFVAVDVNT